MEIRLSENNKKLPATSPESIFSQFRKNDHKSFRTGNRLYIFLGKWEVYKL